MKEINRVLNYWFGTSVKPLSKEEQNERWYQSTPAVDQEIRSQFDDLNKQARGQLLDHWQDSARGYLALIILLDQMSRNMYRATANAFAQDNQALEICLRGIQLGYDKQLSLIERIFYYHPFEHSENIEHQKLSVASFSHLLTEFTEPTDVQMIDNALFWAKEHLHIIDQFGRFPHRNDILGRTSSSDELTYLKTANTFGQNK